MKRLPRWMLCVALVLHGCIYAQQLPLPAASDKSSKPKLFANLPDSFEVDKQELHNIFSASINENITAQLSNAFVITGNVVAKNQHTPGSISVNIRVSNYSNALFNLTLRLQADNSSAIQGRLLHPKYGDVLLLFKEQDKYFLKKESQALLMPD